MPTLMHDHTYRMGICWQNTAYNQPPHLGYYLPDAMMPRVVATEKVVLGTLGQEMTFESKGRYTSYFTFVSTTLPDGTEMRYSVPENFEKNTANKTLLIKGVPQQVGDYKFAFTIKGLGSEQVADTVVFRVSATDGIVPQQQAAGDVHQQVYDAAGHLVGTSLDNLPRGLYIVRRQSATGLTSYKAVRP